MKTFDYWYPNFTVIFDLMPTDTNEGEDANKWRNILHISSENNSVKYGSRIPAVFFKPQTTKLIICSAINDNANRCYFGTDNVPINTWSRIRISQYRVQSEVPLESVYKFVVLVNGEELFAELNEAGSTFSDAMLYTSNPFNPAAAVQIRNLEVSTTRKYSILNHFFVNHTKTIIKL